MSEPIFSPAARQDLFDILEHIARDKPGAATRFVERLQQECSFLAQNPDVGTLRKDLQLTLRNWTVEKYVIFFRPSHDGVEIVRVVHAARDIEAILWR
jgi:toxin ParE1/3/4